MQNLPRSSAIHNLDGGVRGPIVVGVISCGWSFQSAASMVRAPAHGRHPFYAFAEWPGLASWAQRIAHWRCHCAWHTMVCCAFAVALRGDRHNEPLTHFVPIAAMTVPARWRSLVGIDLT
jgi:hypothetical protein